MAASEGSAVLRSAKVAVGGHVNINFPYCRRLLKLSLIGLLIAHALALTTRGQSKPQGARTSELVLRKLMNKFVMPVYPEGAQKRGEHGVAVAEVQVDEKGALMDIQILEAPSDEIGNAVKDAIRQCEFQPGSTPDGPIRIHGKLAFYFVIENGYGTVKNPKKIKS